MQNDNTCGFSRDLGAHSHLHRLAYTRGIITRQTYGERPRVFWLPLYLRYLLSIPEDGREVIEFHWILRVILVDRLPLKSFKSLCHVFHKTIPVFFYAIYCFLQFEDMRKYTNIFIFWNFYFDFQAWLRNGRALNGEKVIKNKIMKEVFIYCIIMCTFQKIYFAIFF